MSWYSNSGDIVVSTRIRIARNINNLPFPHKMSSEQIKEFCAKIKDIIKDKEFSFGYLKFISADDAVSEISAMVERHILSPNFANNFSGKAILISEDETISVMICEEDHLRIQVILGDNKLDEALKIAKEVDKFFNESLDIAFTNELGFLTSCPTNIGTGLRASLMLHIPAIQNLKVIEPLSDSISKIGFTLRGLYGEGSKAEAGFYQVSNQVTLGITEEEAINNLQGIASQIVNREKEARKELSITELDDLTFRSLATLKAARILSSGEAANLISLVKLGVSENRIKDLDNSLLLKLFIETKPNTLQTKEGILTPNDRDVLRANIIREALKECDLYWNIILMDLPKTVITQLTLQLKRQKVLVIPMLEANTF